MEIFSTMHPLTWQISRWATDDAIPDGFKIVSDDEVGDWYWVCELLRKDSRGFPTPEEALTHLKRNMPLMRKALEDVRRKQHNDRLIQNLDLKKGKP